MIASNCNIMTSNHGFKDRYIPMNLQKNETNENGTVEELDKDGR